MNGFFVSLQRDPSPERLERVVEAMPGWGNGSGPPRSHESDPLRMVGGSPTGPERRRPTQPVVHDGDALVFEGQLTRPARLLSDLRDSGIRLSQDEPPEVRLVLEALRAWGMEALERIQGRFGLAFWERSSRRLLVARDPLGMASLYYTRNPDGGLEVSPAIPALLEGTSRKADPASLSWYLSLGYVPAPRTGFFDVKAVPPGHCLVWEEGSVRDQVKYRDPVEESVAGTVPGDGTDGLPEQLRRELAERFSDRVAPVVWDTGGNASRLLISQLRAVHPEPVRVLGVQFVDGTDSDSAARGSDRGTNESLHRIEPALEERLSRGVRAAGVPIADPSMIRAMALAERTDGSAAGIVSSVGGGVLLGIHERYALQRRLENLGSRMPGLVRRMIAVGSRWISGEVTAPSAGSWLSNLSLLDRSRAARYVRLVGLGAEQYKEELGRGPLEAPASRGGEQWLGRWFRRLDRLSDPVEQAMAVDLVTRLPGADLRLLDTACRLDSFPWETPYLDGDLVEWRLGLFGQGASDRQGTSRFRSVYESSMDRPDPVDPASRDRVLIRRWFRRGPEKEYLRNRLLEPHDGMDRILDRSLRETLHGRLVRGDEDQAPLLWALVVLREWMERFDVRI